MVDLSDLKSTADKLRWLATRGQEAFAARLVIADLVHPILNLISAMESTRGERWYTLTEAIRMTGRRKNFFEKPRRRCGGLSRLEEWKRDGLADQADGGIWLISPIKVREAGGGGELHDEGPQATEPTAVDISATVERLTGRRSA